MIHRTTEDWKHRPMILLIDQDHMRIIKDDTWTGMNLYTVNDLDLLITWWNMTIFYAADRITREIKDKKIQAWHAALWIRINMLHKKHFLRFDDITQPELLKKTA
jgi:hypothetical protein